LVLAAVAGCGSGLYPVRGTVTLDDGTPVTKGLVVFESTAPAQGVSARGTLGADGRFQLSTNRTGDGVPPGTYKVLINPMDLSDLPDEKKNVPYDVKYMNFATSGLTFEVKAGDNDFPIKLAKRAKAR
jgi:hypothetical protein